MGTPLMNLNQSTPGVTSGLSAAQNIELNWPILDSHNHSSGQGAQIPSAGLNINAELGFNGNRATSLLSTNYNSQAGVLSGATNDRSVYVLGSELYFRDGAGNNVQITNSGSIAGTSGSIGGLVSPASLQFSSNTFIFRTDATPLQSRLQCSDILLFPLSSGATNSVTIRNPTSTTTTWTLTLPDAPPASQSYLSISTVGTLTAVSANTIADAVTRTNGTTVGVRGVALSTPTTSFNTTSTTAVDITNMTVTITTSGRPVCIAITPSGLALGQGQFELNKGAVLGTFTLSLVRGATTIASSVIGTVAAGTVFWPSCIFNFVDVVAAGTYTYKMQILIGGSSTGVTVRDSRLTVYEL